MGHRSDDEWITYDTKKRQFLSAVHAKKVSVRDVPARRKPVTVPRQTEPKKKPQDAEPKSKRIASAKLTDGKVVLWIRLMRMRLRTGFTYRVQWRTMEGRKVTGMGNLFSDPVVERAHRAYELQVDRAMKRGWNVQTVRQRQSFRDFPDPTPERRP